MTNPFAGYGQIALEDRFIGRDGDLTLLMQRLTSSASVNVIGQNKVGKSSLVAEALRRVEDSNRRPTVSINLATVIPSSARFFNLLLSEVLIVIEDDELTTRVNNIVGNQPLQDPFDAYVRCQQGLRLIAKVGRKILVVIDEFDAIRLIDEPGPTMQRLRELISKPKETGLSAVLITRRSLRALEEQVRSVSRLALVCPPHRICLLGREALDAMVLRSNNGVKISEDDQKKIWSHSGGHPYILEMIFFWVWDAGSVDAALQKCIGELNEYYVGLKTLLSEDELLDHLIQCTVGPRWSVTTDSITRLLNYGLITQVAGTKATYRAFSDHFQAYLEKVAREEPFWELWKNVELGLRDIIDSECTRKYGDDWQEELKRKHNDVRTCFVECREKQEKEQRFFGSGSTENILSYTYPWHLWLIISLEWKLFEGVFGKNKQHWQDRFDHLGKIRNSHAHNRESFIPRAQLKLAEAYCEELLCILK